MTTPPPTEQPVAEFSSPLLAAWAQVGDVPYSDRRRIDLGDSDEWDRQLWRASELLYAYTGQRWRGRGGTRTVTLNEHPDAPGWQPSWAACGCWRHAGPGPARAHHAGPRSVRLPDHDVTSVVEVRIAGEPVPPAEYRMTMAGELERVGRRRRSWPVCGGVTEIDYRYGWAPPAGAVRAASDLAVQYARSIVDGESDLPDRVTSLTREAVSYEFDTGTDSVDKLLTGVDRIDRWIRSVNPYGRPAEASVISPDLYTATP